MKWAVLTLAIWITRAIPAFADDVAWRSVAIPEPAVHELTASNPIRVERVEPLFCVRLATDISRAAQRDPSSEPQSFATIPTVQPASVTLPFVPIPNPTTFAHESDLPLLTSRKSLWFFDAEYLLMWQVPSRIPLLATTADKPQFGFLGQPGTTKLLGPGRFGESQRNGLRLRGGSWFSSEEQFGVEASYTTFSRTTDRVRFDSQQFPTIARPIYVPNIGGEFAELVAFPGLSHGNLTVAQTSDLWGAEFNLRSRLPSVADSRWEGLAGYRHWNLSERLTITEMLIAERNAPVPIGTNMEIRDRFAVRNQFHGGQVGLRGSRDFGAMSFDARGTVAVGANREEIEIAGVQHRVQPGLARETFNGGLLAAGPNLGRFVNERISVVPEGNASIGWNITTRLKAYVGYNVVVWTNVARPGDQIDRTVDLRFVPNAPQLVPTSVERPSVPFVRADFLVHGLQFGMQGRW